jgi:alpha-D-xyloside xylohydrolase
MLVRSGAVIPHIKLAQSTHNMDWSNLELKVYGNNHDKATGLICLPVNQFLKTVSVIQKDGAFQLESDPFAGTLTLRITPVKTK